MSDSLSFGPQLCELRKRPISSDNLDLSTHHPTARATITVTSSRSRMENFTGCLRCFLCPSTYVVSQPDRPSVSGRALQVPVRTALGEAIAAPTVDLPHLHMQPLLSCEIAAYPHSVEPRFARLNSHVAEAVACLLRGDHELAEPGSDEKLLALERGAISPIARRLRRRRMKARLQQLAPAS